MPENPEYDRALHHAVFFDVSGRGKIELTGDDTASFLHNLCTNDIVKLAVGAGCEAFLTTAKARVVAHLFVFRTASGLWLDTSPGQAQTVLKHLDFYLISEQVELADRTDEFVQSHLCGPPAETVLHEIFKDLPHLPSLGHEERTLDSERLKIRRNDSLGLPGYDLVCAAAAAESLKRRLIEAGATPAGAQTHEILRIEAGLPVFGQDIDENRFVVEVGRIPQAISYTKGCYLGQEPIVMARDRGHVNRTLMGLAVAVVDPVAPGAKVLEGDQEVGQVTSSAHSPRFGVIALAYLRRGSQQPGTALEVETASGRAPAIVRALPFV
jgi:folate-binding protein YgfZ